MKDASRPRPRPARRRVLIADDHPMMREGLAQLIGGQADLAVCGEAATAGEALDRSLKLKPDLVLLDISLPDKSGLEVIKDLRAVLPGLRILVISMHDETLYAERVLRAGGRGYLMKHEGSARLLDAMRQVLDGRICVSERISERILESFSGKGHPERGAVVGRLTDREFEVFELLGEGRSAQEIAAALHLSVKTVEVHRLNLKAKLGIKTAPELIRFAVRWAEAQAHGTGAPSA